MRKIVTVSAADKTFGLRDKDGMLYIGNKEAKINEINIIVGNKEYAGTPWLWELLVARSPDDKLFTNGDYDNYAKIMHSTNAMTEFETFTRMKDDHGIKFKTSLEKTGNIETEDSVLFNRNSTTSPI